MVILHKNYAIDAVVMACYSEHKQSDVLIPASPEAHKVWDLTITGFDHIFCCLRDIVLTLQHLTL